MWTDLKLEKQRMHVCDAGTRESLPPGIYVVECGLHGRCNSNDYHKAKSVITSEMRGLVCCELPHGEDHAARIPGRAFDNG